MPALGYIVVTLQFKREGAQWTGRCLQLGTSVYGDTFEEVQGDLAEAIGLQLNALEDVGERKRFFRDFGIRFYRQKPPFAASPTPLSITEPIMTQKRLIPIGAQ